MDQKRLPLFIALSVAILLLFQYLSPPKPRLHQAVATQNTPSGQTPAPLFNPAPPGHEPEHVAPPATVDPSKIPRTQIDGPRVTGTVSLLGARLDDLRLRDYHETVSKTSPLVRVLEPAFDPQPSYVQFGWTGDDGIKTPDSDTVWTSGGGAVSAGHPVALTWDNGAGLTFRIEVGIDANYMFTVRQSVHNAGSTAVQLWPWQRIHRDYLPPSVGLNVFEGVLGVSDAQLHDMSYSAVKSAAAKNDDVGYDHTGAGGWAGFTDKYWLTALVPDQSAPAKTTWNHVLDNGSDRFQVSYIPTDAEHVAAGGDAAYTSRVFAGAMNSGRRFWSISWP